MRAITIRRFIAPPLLAALLVACGGPEKPKPTPLEMPAPSVVRAPQVWSQRLGRIAMPMRVAVNGQVLTAATSDGTVIALDAATGQELWRASTGADVAAGVGSDGTVAAVVTQAGEVVALAGGKQLWRQRLTSRSVTPPLVAGERVFVYSVDRSVHAFDAETGAKLWTQQRPGDPLTLAQPGVLLAVRDTLVVGQGPRLAGLDPLKGTLRWEVAVASPRGTNEVERLADLVGPAGRVGDQVCARAFQSAVGCVNTERGTLAWTRNSTGATGVFADDNHVYTADASDKLTTYRRSNGEVAWDTERLRFRGLSAPVAVGRSVVFGDAEGYLHMLSRDDGTPLGRVTTDGSALAGAPVVVGNLLVVATRNGGVYAFRPE
jgi:outer membrane assembly lipoprotein YfgL